MREKKIEPKDSLRSKGSVMDIGPLVQNDNS